MSSLARRAAALAATIAVAAVGSVARADVTSPHPGLTLVNHPGQDAMIIVDLCADGVSIRATKYAERKGTPQQWGQGVGVQAAMNADFFDFPGWTYVIGRARGAGEDWPANAQQKEGRPYWQFGPGIAQGEPNGGAAPLAGVTEIVGGHNVIISGGNTTGPWSDANDGQLLNTSHARSAIGSSADRRTLYMMSTTSSISASTLVTRLQQSAAEAGAPTIDYATNQDGGGSSQLYVQNLGQVISTGRQVNNHLGVFATGGGEPTMCNDQRPRGYIDSAGCDVIKGWAQDVDAPDAPIDVVLGFNGAPGAMGIPTEKGTAGVHRDDLCAAIQSCNHGFELLPPYSLFDGAPHLVVAKGLDQNGTRDQTLSGSPQTMKCATPDLAGVLRHVVDPMSYAAWGFVGFIDQLSVTDPDLAALKMSIDLPGAPQLLQGEGQPEVWLIDGPTGKIRRHVPDPTVAARWHLDLGTVTKVPAADIESFVVGPPLRDRPMLVKGSGPAVYLLDDDLTPPLPTTGAGGKGGGGGGFASGGGGKGGAGGGASTTGGSPDASCSCRAAGAMNDESSLGRGLAAVAVLGYFVARRRR
jgi:MYXO-CTERM domain-containing protein